MCVTNSTVSPPCTNSTVSSLRKNRLVTKSLKKLYEDRDKTGDVCFIVGSTRIRAHRCVLASISSKYETQFYGCQPDKGDVIVPEEHSPYAFIKFIQLFYLDEILMTTKVVEEVLVLAKQSRVGAFVQLCVDFLIDVAPLGNVFLGYRLALFYDFVQLKDLCESIIKRDTVKIFQSEDFIVNCDFDSLLSVLKLDTLNCKESEAFNACIKWAKDACKRNNTDPEEAENLRIELDNIITEIRFRSMTIEEFANIHRSNGQFFSPDEINEIIYLIGKVKSYKSAIFNQRPRNSSEKTISIACSELSLRTNRRECNRVLSYSPVYYTSFLATSYMSFYCDHSIRLEGFTVGCSEYERVAEPVLTFNGLRNNRRIPSMMKKEINKTIVTFDKPIDVSPNQKIGILCSITDITVKRIYEWAAGVSMGSVSFMFDNNNVNNDNFVTALLYKLK
ncbi:BTB/POZ domain-containing protein 2-like [Bradysia coprophila]|uniref:BTB/POZ domain-containing protein 2-like n=1 Tax=Bradysia coprophila TaxID=38358 RepID=UPI00187DB020|nr:BTB/POZ domain-containing protein 2-like [Bradysia coprophila]